MDTPYQDPENVEELLIQLRSLKDHADIRNFIYTHLPEWIVSWSPGYSPDYPHLTQNWQIMCNLTGCKKQLLVMVRWISFDDIHKLIQAVSDRMTEEGYVVRRQEEFVVCENANCGRLIPSKPLYEHMKKKNIPVPETWLNRCRMCVNK